MPKSAEAQSKPAPFHIGHRTRLRQKILDFGAETLQEYEILEYLLMQAIPRKDVKPLAKQLLAEFGSFANVLNASPAELQKINGIKETTASLIIVVKACAVLLAKRELKTGHIIKDEKSLIEYCKVDMAEKKIEMLRVFFLDTQNRLIKDEILQKGTIGQTPIYPREVAKRALDLGAVSVILIHNHPSGDVTPSRNDIIMTKAVQDALNPLGITLIDHFIISKSGFSSFKARGYIK